MSTRRKGITAHGQDAPEFTSSKCSSLLLEPLLGISNRIEVSSPLFRRQVSLLQKPIIQHFKFKACGPVDRLLLPITCYTDNVPAINVCLHISKNNNKKKANKKPASVAALLGGQAMCKVRSLIQSNHPTFE